MGAIFVLFPIQAPINKYLSKDILLGTITKWNEEQRDRIVTVTRSISFRNTYHMPLFHLIIQYVKACETSYISGSILLFIDS